MRHLVIGDIHGCFNALTTLAKFVPIGEDDTLITLGDYVDRGPNSCAVIDWLIHRHKKGKLIPLKGNHEIMMLDARMSKDDLERWLFYGGDRTLASYSVLEDAGDLADVPDEHWHFIEHELRSYHELDAHFFVHANAYPDHELAEQPDYMLFWESLSNTAPHMSGKTMVCGHTSQKSGRPKNLGYLVCLDTWVYGKGWLTCLDLQSGQYWQANEVGETRRGNLDEHLEE